MTREWLTLFPAMLAKVKYRRLSPIGRGALLHVLILAAFQTPEATWDDPDELRESLMLEGFPEGAFDELMALGWLELEDGAVIVHDWDAHQIAATLEVKRTWEAKRKREWRRKKKGTPSPEPLTPKKTSQPQPQDIGPGPVPDMSRTPKGWDEVVGEYQRLFGHVTEPKRLYLQNIISRWPAERVMEGLRQEQANGATRRDICGRLELGLQGGDRLAAAATMQLLEDRVAAEATA
jgi:hypothetical protein